VPDHLAESVDYYLEVEGTEYGQQDGSEFRYRRKLATAAASGLSHAASRLILATDRPVYRPGQTVSLRAWLPGRYGANSPGGPVHAEMSLLGPRGQVMAVWPRRPVGSGRTKETGSSGASLDYRLAARASPGQWTFRAKLGTEVTPFPPIQVFDRSVVKRVVFLVDFWWDEGGGKEP
jgi:uncharacterized protein YfaS (alpha-2-macroglobulin family)